MSLEIVIRNTTGSSPDESYTMPLTASVLELKQMIRDRHPLHPQPHTQRLIFCGKILNDNDAIGTIGPVPEGGNKVVCILFISNRNTPSQPLQNQDTPVNNVARNLPQNGQNLAGAVPAGPQFVHGPFGMVYGFGPVPRGMIRPFMPQMYHQHFPGGQAGFPGQGIPNMFPGNHLPAQNGGFHFQFQLDLKLLFIGLVLAFMAITHGGTSGFMFLALILAFMLHQMFRRPAVPEQAIHNAQAGNQQPLNEQGVRRQTNVPNILQYDWRQHTGITGEILGFICPFIFSLWPSWDPTVLRDNPREGRNEAANHDVPPQPEAQQ